MFEFFFSVPFIFTPIKPNRGTGKKRKNIFNLIHYLVYCSANRIPWQRETKQKLLNPPTRWSTIVNQTFSIRFLIKVIKINIFLCIGIGQPTHMKKKFVMDFSVSPTISRFVANDTNCIETSSLKKKYKLEAVCVLSVHRA